MGKVAATGVDFVLDTADDTYNVACVSLDQSNCPKPAGPDWDFGSSPILVKLASGKRALLAGQKSGVVTALDPDNHGEILWQTRTRGRLARPFRFLCL